MRTLWPIERNVLEIAAAEFADQGAALRRQAETARVVSFENSGAGFFSRIIVANISPLSFEKFPLDVGFGNVLGLEHGMGFLVFLNDGRLSMIEGYCNGNESTAKIDFSRAVFDLVPWSRAQNAIR